MSVLNGPGTPTTDPGPNDGRQRSKRRATGTRAYSVFVLSVSGLGREDGHFFDLFGGYFVRERKELKGLEQKGEREGEGECRLYMN